jgi:hypothetical protein
MSTTKTTFTVLALGLAAFLSISFFDNTGTLSYNPATPANLVNLNTPVHLAGCTTFERPVPPKVVFPTVTKNFVTRLCALEVYPPYAVLLMQKSAQKQN